MWDENISSRQGQRAMRQLLALTWIALTASSSVWAYEPKLRSTFVVHNSPGRIAFSPDGRTLALATGLNTDDMPSRTIGHWDVATGKNIANIDAGSETTQCAVFSPDGNILASVWMVGGKVKLWDVAALGQEEAASQLPGHGEGKTDKSKH
jgi:WD40 repeat protein